MTQQDKGQDKGMAGTEQMTDPAVYGDPADKADPGMAQAAQSDPEQQRLVIELDTPYRFENKEYPEIDLSGLEKLTVQDAIDAQREIFGENEVAALGLCETTTAFARKLAGRATGLPAELLAPRRVSRRVTLAVRSFLSGGRETERHVMRLEKPCRFQGKEYTEVDLSAVGDLNSLQESEAENRMARAGFVVTETSFNYLYACILASMASGLPEEFFTGLPLCETLKLKNAVNDPDFSGKGGARALRKAAIRLSAVTRTGVDFYLKLPVREFVALNQEVAEEYKQAAKWKRARN